jgi:hypothetical protein
MTNGSAKRLREEPLPLGEIDPRRLAEANINPATGLATDYLNHFNEAIMLLEMLAAAPDCVEDFISWRPLSYSEHFAESGFKERDIAIASYHAADPVARQRIDALADTMTAVLTATRQALQLDHSGPPAPILAARAADCLKPLVARAGAVINGTDGLQGSDTDLIEPQAVVDALMARL